MGNILTIKNKHVKSCGIAPQFNSEALLWKSYFENELGEQFFFIIRKQGPAPPRQALVYAGDIGWTEPFDPTKEFPMLHSNERLWITACLAATKYLREGWEA